MSTLKGRKGDSLLSNISRRGSKLSERRSSDLLITLTENAGQKNMGVSKIFNKFFAQCLDNITTIGSDKNEIEQIIESTQHRLRKDYNSILKNEVPYSTLSQDFKNFKEQRQFKRNLISILMEGLNEKEKLDILMKHKQCQMLEQMVYESSINF